MYGPFGGTVKAWNSCEHLANIVRRRLRLQPHNVLRSLVTRGTHALSPCKILPKKGKTKREKTAAPTAASNTCTPHGHTGTSIIALRISARAFTFQQTRATRVRHEAGGSETETARMVSLSISYHRSGRRAHSACVRGNESSGTTSHRTRTATGHRHSHGLQVGTKSSLGLLTKGLGVPNPPKV